MLLDFTIDMASRFIKKKKRKSIYKKKEQQQEDEELKIKIKSKVYLALLRI